MVNKNKIKEIVESLELKEGDIIIEIGPGHGELTEEIIEKFKYLNIKKCKVIAIEKDEELAKDLKNKFAENKNVEILEGDALKILPDLNSKFQIPNSKFKLVGNIPYYITGFLFRVLESLDNKPGFSVFMVQKEVAERICAKPPKMNILSASAQFWATPEIIAYAPKKDFDPVPEVDSAVIKMTTNKQQPAAEEKNRYYGFVKIIFKQPRKTILNNLRQITGDQQLIKSKLESLKINAADRPQNLSLEQLSRLSGVFSDIL